MYVWMNCFVGVGSLDGRKELIKSFQRSKYKVENDELLKLISENG